MSGRIRICNGNPPRGGQRLRGTDLYVYLVDSNDQEHLLPVASIKLECNGRKDYVLAEVKLIVSDIDLDLAATLIREDVDLD